MGSELRGFGHEQRISDEYRLAFGAFYEEGFQVLRAYVQSLTPAVREVIEASGPFKQATGFPENFKPHSIWIAQFFGVTDRAVMIEAFVASVLMEMHCCMQDRRIDGELRGNIDNITSDALSNILLTGSLVRFAAIAQNPQFHAAVHNAFSDLAEAYIAEASGAVPYLAADRMFRAIVDRAAPFHILVAAMGYHSGRADKIEACSRMVCHLIMWFQMLDDATDWKKDLAKGRQTFLLHRLTPFLDKPFAEWRPDDVANALYLFGGAESMLPECIGQLEAALDIALAHAASPALEEDSPQGLVRWLRMFLTVHRDVLAQCIQRKWDFLNALPAASASR